jgi:EmrB/QacA subfamily drug resistance transporter
MIVAGDGTDRKGAALALLCTVQFMVVLDNAIGNVALPSIREDLGFAEGQLQYVISLYALTFGGFLILAGRAGDLFGRRAFFIAGTAIFGAASLGCALADSKEMLLAGRAAQGLGAAFVSATALALISNIFAEGAERNRALGVWGGVAAAGAAAGMILGGVLTDAFGWEACFLVNVPIAVVAIAVAPALLPESRERGAGRRLDLPGAFAVTAGIGLLVYGLTRGQEDGFGSTVALVLLSGAALALVVFVVLETRVVGDPLVPFRIFRTPGLSGANLGSLALAMTIAGQGFFCTLYMQQVLGFSPIQTGLAFLPISLLALVGAGVASQLALRLGPGPVMAAGLGLAAAGCALLTGISAQGTYAADLLPGFVLFGIGLGLAFVSATIAATAGVADDEQGLASGLLSTSQQVGFAVGVAVLVTIAVARADALGAGGGVESVLGGYRLGLWVAAGIALGGVPAALSIRRARLRTDIREAVGTGVWQGSVQRAE